MFDNLSQRLQDALSSLTRKGKLTEKDVDAALREIRMALLEADVNYKVVKDFTRKVKEKAIGEGVMKSLTPGQMVIKIVREELVDMMQSDDQALLYASKGPTVVMLCGLQGAGKTTQAGKLARLYQKKNKRPLLLACDVYRPAAVKQLEVVGEKAGVDVFQQGTDKDPVAIAREGVAYARKTGHDLVIIDTAGRLQVDERLMEELQRIKQAVDVTETLLVVDAMTGQEAVNVAQTFNEKVGITGVILSKLDGDERGGAALSIRAVTNKPIKLVGTGEKLDDFQEFHPDRMVSRILGMGDVLSLIEKAEQAYDEEQAAAAARKVRDQTFDLNDFSQQLNQLKNMGPLDELLKMIPGMNKQALQAANMDEKQVDRIQAILSSMTDEERRNPGIINKSRRERIARGSGQDITQVNRLLKQFKSMKKMMKQMGGYQKKLMRRGGFRNPFF